MGNVYNSDAGSFSSIAIYNAVPSSISAGVYRNSKSEPMKLASELLAFKDLLPYRNFMAGEKNILVDLVNEFSTNSFQQSLKFSPNKAYSLFIIDDNAYKLLLTEDNVIKPSKGKSKIRLVHLSKTVGQLSYQFNNIDKKISFKDVTDFNELESNKTINITLSDGRGESYRLEDHKLVDEGIYSLLIIGNKDNANEISKAQLMLVKH